MKKRMRWLLIWGQLLLLIRFGHAIEFWQALSNRDRIKLIVVVLVMVLVGTFWPLLLLAGSAPSN